jgi:PPIC-type PPIASE domain
VRGRYPDFKHVPGLVDNWVREEIFYREGLAMGLDRDDPVVRRRIGQKVEFIVDGMIPATPTTAELQAWLDAQPERYASETRYSLRQMYFDPSRHEARLEKHLTTARRALELGESTSGDSTMLPATLQAATTSEVEKNFGTDFVAALQTLPVGSWQGPVRSGFDVHLVQVTQRQDGRPVTLEQVRNEVERDMLHDRTQQAAEAFYKRLRSNYAVRIDGAIAPAADPSG